MEVVWSLNGLSQKIVVTVIEMTGTDMAVTEGAVIEVEESSATNVVNEVILPEIVVVGVDQVGIVLIETEVVTGVVTEAVIAGEQEAAIDEARAVILGVLATQEVHLEESTQDILSVTAAHH